MGRLLAVGETPVMDCLGEAGKRDETGLIRGLGREMCARFCAEALLAAICMGGWNKSGLAKNLTRA